MVQIKTFTMMMICFIGTLSLTERYLMRHEPTLKIYQILLMGLAIMIFTGAMIVFIPVLFPMMIYVSVIVSSFICTYCRHKFEKEKEIS